MKRIFQNAEDVRNVLPSNKRFALIGGCFDLIHVGHVHLLEHSASLEDLVVVAVLSDKYCKKYKDPQRPIISKQQRASMVASIRYVDYVYISDVSPSSPETLRLLMPSSVVFGVDSSNSDKLEKRLENIKEYSPKTSVQYLPRYSDEVVSTTCIIHKIMNSKS